MKIIILDTNALMAIGQFKLDVFSEIDKAVDFTYEIKVLDKIVEELEKIKEKGGKRKENARLALEIIEKKGLKEIKTKGEERVDDILGDLAKKGAIIVTQDKELKRRIKKTGSQMMVIKQKKRIVWG